MNIMTVTSDDAQIIISINNGNEIVEKRGKKILSTLAAALVEIYIQRAKRWIAGKLGK